MIGVVRNESLAGKVIEGQWKKNSKLKDVGYAIIMAHRFKCSSCGIQSLASKEHPDGFMVPVDVRQAGLAATKEAGALCLCPLCASAQATNWSVVPKVVDGEHVEPPGLLIYLPFKSQIEVTRLAIFVLACLQKPNDHPLFSVATDIAAAMLALGDEVSKKVPIYNGTNADFVKALSRLPDEYYEKRVEIIGSLRWWPNTQYWETFGRYMLKGGFNQFDKTFGLERKINALMKKI